MADQFFNRHLALRPSQAQLNQQLVQTEPVQESTNAEKLAQSDALGEIDAPKKPANPPAAPGKQPWEFKAKPFKYLKPQVGLVYDDTIRHTNIFDNRDYTQDLVNALKINAVLDDVRYNRTFVDHKFAQVFAAMKEHAGLLVFDNVFQWLDYWVMDGVEWVRRAYMAPDMLLELVVRLVKARQRWLANPAAQKHDGNQPVPRTVAAIDAFLKEYYTPDVPPLVRRALIPDFGAYMDDLDKDKLAIGDVDEDGYEAHPDKQYVYDSDLDSDYSPVSEYAQSEDDVDMGGM